MTDRAEIGLRRVGRTDLHVTELGFGAATLGNLYNPVTDEVARAAIDAAMDSGMSYVDTAPYYGFGLSERRVGDAIRARPDLAISTKVGRLLAVDPSVRDDAERHGFRSPMPFRPVYDYSYDAIMRSHEDSLQRLGRGRIDILYVHDIGRLTHGEQDRVHFDALTTGGGLKALEELRDGGAITAFGIGVNEVEACERVMGHARLDVILLAGRYTLLEQGALDTLFPRCEAAGTSIVIGGPYNSGILATGTAGKPPLHYDYGEAPPEIVARVAAIEAICRSHNVPLPAAALQFVLAHPVVASVIPGLGSAARVAQTMELYRTGIPQQLWADLRNEGLIGANVPVPGDVVPA